MRSSQEFNVLHYTQYLKAVKLFKVILLVESKPFSFKTWYFDKQSDDMV